MFIKLRANEEAVNASKIACCESRKTSPRFSRKSHHDFAAARWKGRGGRFIFGRHRIVGKWVERLRFASTEILFAISGFSVIEKFNYSANFSDSTGLPRVIIIYRKRDRSLYYAAFRSLELVTINSFAIWVYRFLFFSFSSELKAMQIIPMITRRRG